MLNAPHEFELLLDDCDMYDVEIECDDYDVCMGSTITNIVNTDYLPLENKPSINGVTLVGDLTSADIFVDQTYIHTQNVASDIWTIVHNLEKYPSVTVVDSAGSVVIGDVLYSDNNTIVLAFQGAFSGIAYLN